MRVAPCEAPVPLHLELQGFSSRDMVTNRPRHRRPWARPSDPCPSQMPSQRQAQGLLLSPDSVCPALLEGRTLPCWTPTLAGASSLHPELLLLFRHQNLTSQQPR